jgi:iron transport multicopper oxidase
MEQCDGLRGALVIYDPNDPLAYMYDVDDGKRVLIDLYQNSDPSRLSPESTVITLSDWWVLGAL